MDKNTSLISSLWSYVKKPDYNLAPIDEPFIKKLSDILKYWSLGIVVAFFVSILSAAFLSNIGVDDSQNVLQDFFANSSIFIVALIAFFVGPITEELTFRLGLRYSPYRLGFALVFILFLLFELLTTTNAWFKVMLSGAMSSLGIFMFLGGLFVLMILFGLLFGYILSRCKFSQRIDNFYQKNFSIIFYGFTLTFATMHFFNFANFKSLWFVLPILVAPQLFLGFILAYIRMRYNLVWSIFYHFFYNTLAALPILLFAQISDKSFDVISRNGDNSILNMPFVDRLFLVTGAGTSLFVFVIAIIFFVLLIKDHNKYLKLKKTLTK